MRKVKTTREKLTEIILRKKKLIDEDLYKLKVLAYLISFSEEDKILIDSLYQKVITRRQAK